MPLEIVQAFLCTERQVDLGFLNRQGVDQNPSRLLEEFLLVAF
jgi:hypothetical protein